MPFSLKKDPKKKGYYWVVTTATGNKHSLKSLPKAKAEAQLTAIRISYFKK